MDLVTELHLRPVYVGSMERLELVGPISSGMSSFHSVIMSSFFLDQFRDNVFLRVVSW